MNRIFQYLFMILLSANTLWAQDSVYVIHPAVGEKIDKATKNKYLLFPEIKDSAFEFCTVKKSHEKYFVVTHFKNDSLAISPIELNTLVQYMQNIEKLNEYYNNKSKTYTIPNKINSRNSEKSTLNKALVAPVLTDQQKREIERDERLKSDAQDMDQFRHQGSGSTPLNFEIYNTEKKK